MAAERRQYDRRKVRSATSHERRRDVDRRGRRAADPVDSGFDARRRRLRVEVLESRRAIEASRDALKKRKP
jgi:hypothetical protein